jgi:hypothetical protein
MGRPIPDAPIDRCEGCGSERVIPLTWTEERFRARSEQHPRASAKCATCGLRYYPPARQIDEAD